MIECMRNAQRPDLGVPYRHMSDPARLLSRRRTSESSHFTWIRVVRVWHRHLEYLNCSSVSKPGLSENNDNTHLWRPAQHRHWMIQRLMDEVTRPYHIS